MNSTVVAGAGVSRVAVLLLLLSGCHVWPSRPLAVVGPGAGTIRVVTDSGRVRAVLKGQRRSEIPW